MKVACASSAFDGAIARGDLTQLEWIETCARDLACDGVVLDVRHFPRTDAEYLAQIKKFATDLGLTIAALDDDAFFRRDADGIATTLALAVELGAPLLSIRLARETELTWSEQLERLKTATARAKARNVTLALRNAPQTFAASAYDCKRAVKQADSAWLAFGLEPGAFDAASDDPTPLLPRTVLLWQSLAAAREGRLDRVLATFPEFLGSLAFDEPGGGATLDDVRGAIRACRTALAARELNRA